MLPTDRTTTESGWQSYGAVASAFNQIVPDRTTSAGLKGLGFDPETSPNIRILTYVDIMNIFMPNPSIKEQDLAAPVAACIDSREQSQAYVIDLKDSLAKRHGNLFLDVFGFKQSIHNTGWEFKGLLLLKHGVVVYKLSAGQPYISSDEKHIKPLGPLQEIDGLLLFKIAK